ncbi:MAG: hypothetical protein KKB81_07855 [Candidatus Margulisbacteria bacterium]|nr:hypothetical protein [Candidatus Margulisiibacteriota bacterium]MBU1021792.1 hypothetical protein [Candidatus Margulisiibacteriota bacterium]MBU1729538.1 hypothetical protein [Candidatus Margulisiibacteriota bacterium]MBU1955361.1 hypothetical protein [Candidatus Margulisiibacteriota bacterium]
MPEMRLQLRMQLTHVQEKVLGRARNARRRLEIPLSGVGELRDVAAFRDQLASRMHSVGSDLLGFPLSQEAFTRPHFSDLVKIFLTLQAAWRDGNDKGIELLERGFQHYVEKGNIKNLKYGGTDQTARQIEVAKVLIDKIYPGKGESYMEAWLSDFEIDSFWTTDGLYDWLTMGKVCGGSCQAYDGSPYWNRSLGGPVFSLDKLGFVGENRNKRCRILLVPTPIKVGEQFEWALIIPKIYSVESVPHDQDVTAAIKGALYAAGICGAKRLVSLTQGGKIAGALSAIGPLVVEIKDRDGNVVRREQIVANGFTRAQQQCTIYALRGPNRYKYWDYAGGGIDYDKAQMTTVQGIDVPVVKIETTANFIDIERTIL